jgi:hypothetical protein
LFAPAVSLPLTTGACGFLALTEVTVPVYLTHDIGRLQGTGTELFVAL